MCPSGRWMSLFWTRFTAKTFILSLAEGRSTLRKNRAAMADYDGEEIGEFGDWEIRPPSSQPSLPISPSPSFPISRYPNLFLLA